MTGPRLLVVTSTGQMSGAERVLVQVVSRAVHLGWQVTCAVPRGPLADELEATGVDVVALPELGLATGPRPLAVGRTLWRWARAGSQIRRASRTVDVVLLNALTSLPAATLARIEAPVVWLAHDVVTRPGRLRLYRACRSTLSLVVGVSAAVADQLRGGDVRIEVVHNGVAWPVDAASPSPAGQPVVGINALLTPWKGHQVLLDAVPLLPPDVRVEIMGGQLRGDAAYADQVRRRADDPALGGRVSVLGHVADPLARMRTWSVAVSASTDPEACPLNVLEAMSLGVPVVATDHGGAPEVLAGSGLVVPPGDAPALAGAVSELLANHELHDRCSVAGRERVAAAHRLEVQTSLLLDRLASETRP